MCSMYVHVTEIICIVPTNWFVLIWHNLQVIEPLLRWIIRVKLRFPVYGNDFVWYVQLRTKAWIEWSFWRSCIIFISVPSQWCTVSFQHQNKQNPECQATHLSSKVLGGRLSSRLRWGGVPHQKRWTVDFWAASLSEKKQLEKLGKFEKGLGGKRQLLASIFFTEWITLPISLKSAVLPLKRNDWPFRHDPNV